MSRPRSLLSSTVLHATLIVAACLCWSTYAVAPPHSPVRLVFVPSEATPPPGELAATDESVVVEPVTTELPEPPAPAETAFEPFEPPEPRPLVEPPPPTPEPRDPLVRVVPEPVVSASPASPTDAAAFVEARALDAENVPPAYPPLAVKRGWSGVVTLEVAIDSGGAVTAVVIADSSGHAILDHAAEEAARDWRFEPARRDGVAVPSALRLPVEFRLID